MAEFNRKKSYRRFIYSPLTLFMLFVIFLVLVKAVWGVYAKKQLSSQYLERQQAELDRVTDRKMELAQAVEYLKTEEGIEAEIRSKFRVVKEGESVAVIVGNEEEATTTVATTSPSFLEKIMHMFGF